MRYLGRGELLIDGVPVGTISGAVIDIERYEHLEELPTRQEVFSRLMADGEVTVCITGRCIRPGMSAEKTDAMVEGIRDMLRYAPMSAAAAIMLGPEPWETDAFKTPKDPKVLTLTMAEVLESFAESIAQLKEPSRLTVRELDDFNDALNSIQPQNIPKVTRQYQVGTKRNLSRGEKKIRKAQRGW
jgi:hypothetical protein